MKWIYPYIFDLSLGNEKQWQNRYEKLVHGRIGATVYVKICVE